jgi:hypothetical protein
MDKFLATVLLLASAGMLPAQSSPADAVRQQLEYARSHYTKFDYRIPMRDGVKLYTSVYVPKDTSHSYPILMQRTPYSVAPYGIDNYRPVLGPSELFTREGFIFVYQDVRGRYLSEGAFIDVPVHNTHLSGKETDESTDTYDTIDWLVKNIPNNNGKAGIWGISYPGFYAAFSLIGSHPALAAVSPQAPMGDVGNGDDAYHNGAFYLAANFGFYTSFKPRQEPERPRRGAPFDFGTEDQYAFYLGMGPLSNASELYLKNDSVYWDDLLKHPNYDAFWQARAEAPHMKNVKPAVLWVGGWFDAEDLSGPLKLFYATERNGPPPSDTLIMGPWSHGGWSRGDGDKLGNLNFATKTGEFFREHIELAFFLKNLKGKGDDLPKAWVFETGRNEWVRYGASRRKRLRRVHRRSRQAGSGDRRDRARDGGRLHDLRPAICVPADGRSHLSIGAAGKRRGHCRPDPARAARFHHRHRFGFRREADRRVSRRLPRPGTKPDAASHGRVPADGSRGAVPRQVP